MPRPAGPVRHVTEDLDDAALAQAVEDRGLQGASAAAHVLGLVALEHRKPVVADDHLAVLQVTLIRQVRDLHQLGLQGIDESHRGGRQAHLATVVVQQRFALFPGQQLLAVVGIGFRTAHGHVAGFQFVGQRREHAHLE